MDKQRENVLEKLEAIIFLAGESVFIEELCKFYALTQEEMLEKLHLLKENRKNSGINLKIEGDRVFLVTNPSFGEDIHRFFNPDVKIKKLSRSAMETLAIVAYKGPITKGEIEKIRGVNVDKLISNLLERNLIYVAGRKKALGTPNLYEVTEDFYAYIDIKDKDELPNYEEFKKIEGAESVEKIEDIEVKKDEIE